jgi:hypothetical protein
MNFLKQLFVEILSLLYSLYNNKLKLLSTLLIIIFILSCIFIQNFLSFLVGIFAYLCITFILLVIPLLVPLIISLFGMFIMTKKSYYYCYGIPILINFKYTKYPILNSILYYGSIIGTYCYSLYIIFIIQCKQGYIEVTNTLITPVFDNFHLLEELCNFFK